jgi:hypothetical protein
MPAGSERGTTIVTYCYEGAVSAYLVCIDAIIDCTL